MSHSFVTVFSWEIMVALADEIIERKRKEWAEKPFVEPK